MADLQAALDELKSEVADLEKQKRNLAQDLTSLESKRRFLTQSVGQLKKSKKVADKEHTETLRRHEDALAIIRGDIKEAQKDQDILEKKILAAESDLQTMKDTTDQEIIKLNKQLQGKKDEITAAEKLKTQALKELEGIGEQITAQQSKLSDMQDRVKQAEADTDNEIDDIQRKTEVSKAGLAKINKQLDEKAEQYDDLEAAVVKKQAELDEVTKKHQDYLEYEKRADKTLKAREEALLAGEKDLAEATRRGGVLDNLR